MFGYFFGEFGPWRIELKNYAGGYGIETVAANMSDEAGNVEKSGRRHCPCIVDVGI
jgi:hypothetical protein